MSDPSTSANGLTLDITSDDPGIAYSREAYAEVCRLRAENAEKENMLLNQAKTIKEMQAENEALKEALKPFAELYCGVSMRDDVAAAFTVIGTRGVDNTVITAGYIRRAREAMGEKG